MIQSITGDCREELAKLPAESVHCCVTSPPYFGLRDYGVDGAMGLEDTPEAFIEALVGVFREVRRVLRKDGTVWLNLGDSYAGSGRGPSNGESKQCTNMGSLVPSHRGADGGLKPKDLMMIPARVALALQADGWWLRSDIIWAKPNPMPESVTDRPTSAHEHVFLLAKSAKYYFDAEAVREAALHEGRVVSYDGSQKNTGHQNRTYPGAQPRDIVVSGRNLRNIWTIATAPFPEAHFATFPPKLVEPCIKAGTSEKGCCAECGAPWVREVETTLAEVKAPGSTYGHGAGRNDSGRSMFRGGGTKTLGWAPSCACNADVKPCTVLDPFGGAGTTGLVADRLGRDSILIELNPEYASMARERITRDGPLFANVETGAPT